MENPGWGRHHPEIKAWAISPLCVGCFGGLGMDKRKQLLPSLWFVWPLSWRRPRVETGVGSPSVPKEHKLVLPWTETKYKFSFL